LGFDVSVIMTVKNGSFFIKKAIESILNQSLLPREIIIVDDGSTDDTCTLVEQINLTAYMPIHLIKTVGVGRSKALNLAVEKCSYEWIANLDVDDYWLYSKLEKQVEVILKEPNAQVVTTKSFILTELEKADFISNDSIQRLSYKRLNKVDFYARNPVNHSSILFSKELFVYVGGYNQALRKQIDYDLWVRFVLVSDFFYQVDIPLTVKYLHSMQSYESKNVILYRFSSFFIKVTSLIKFKAPWYFYLKAVFFFGATFLPNRLKNKFRKKIR